MVPIRKILFLTILITVFCFNYSSAQKILVLDVYHVTGNMKRIRFYQKDKLSFRLHESRKFFTHVITFIGDSSIVLDGNWILPISEIEKIKVDGSNHLVHTLSRFLIDCGIGFFVLDSFNSLTNGDELFKPQVIEESAGLIISGLILKCLPVRKYKMNPRRVLKIIDVTP
jgi:hypothetical protein